MRVEKLPTVSGACGNRVDESERGRDRENTTDRAGSISVLDEPLVSARQELDLARVEVVARSRDPQVPGVHGFGEDRSARLQVLDDLEHVLAHGVVDGVAGL